MLSLIFYSCQNRFKIQGIWKCTYVDIQSLDKSNIIFTDLDLFEKNTFEPIFEFTTNTIKYNLGFGGFINNFNDNYCKYKLSNGFIYFNCNQINQSFKLESQENDKFCIIFEGTKMACFQRMGEIEKSNSDMFKIDFKVFNDFFNINLRLFGNGYGIIYREGEIVSDTTKITLDKIENQFIKSVVQSINSSNFRMSNQNKGGDHSKYSLKMEYNGVSYYGEAEGLNGLNFETKSLIINLENLIMMKYNYKNKEINNPN